MNIVNPNRIKFYEYLSANISLESFENWIYDNKELEKYIPKDLYVELISFDYTSHNLIPFIKTIVQEQFDWKEYELWRTIDLLEKIKSEKIEIVLATRKMRQLYFEQEERIKRPLISIGLAIGYESELDICPIESEYQKWNPESLKKQLELVGLYKNRILETVNKELTELLNPEFRTIDLGNIVTIENLHQTFAERLSFPEFYGNNWDAFWDTITGIIEMPKVLTLINYDKFQKIFPKDSLILKEIVKDYNREKIEKKIEITAGNGKCYIT